MTDPVILARDLRIGFAGRPVLHVPELAVCRGEVVAVLGRNGSGKTTLLKTCLGLHRPAAGRLEVLGGDVWRLGWRQRLQLRRRIGFVPQLMAGTHEAALTVREVVSMGRAAVAGLLRPLSRRDSDIVDAWLERLGIGHLAKRRFCEASGGEQRKAVLARAMAQEPEMLLLDEPTAWLDLGWRERIVHLLDDLYGRTRLTILLVCHEMEVLPTCCRRVVMLSDGTVAAAGAPEAVLTDAAVSAFYGGAFRVRHEAGRHVVLPQAPVGVAAGGAA